MPDRITEVTVQGSWRRGYAYLVCLPITGTPGRYHVDAGYRRTRPGCWLAARQALADLRRRDRRQAPR